MFWGMNFHSKIDVLTKTFESCCVVCFFADFETATDQDVFKNWREVKNPSQPIEESIRQEMAAVSGKAYSHPKEKISTNNTKKQNVPQYQL